MGWGGGALKAAVDIPRRGETRGRKIISTSVGRGKGGGGRSSKMAFFVGYVAPLARSATAAKDTDDLFIFLWELEEKEEGEAERKIYESREGGKGGRGKEREEEEAGGKNIFQFSDERSLNANRAAGVEEEGKRKKERATQQGRKTVKTFFSLSARNILRGPFPPPYPPSVLGGAHSSLGRGRNRIIRMETAPHQTSERKNPFKS